MQIPVGFQVRFQSRFKSYWLVLSIWLASLSVRVLLQEQSLVMAQMVVPPHREAMQLQGTPTNGEFGMVRVLQLFQIPILRTTPLLQRLHQVQFFAVV